MEKADGGKFIQIVKEHMERCSHMEPQDFGKLAFQSEFGPEHMMADRQQAESFLIEEWNSLPENNAAGIPRVDRSLSCRSVNHCAVFSYLNADQ